MLNVDLTAFNNPLFAFIHIFVLLKKRIVEKTIAQRLGITKFPFVVKNKNGNIIYIEYENNHYIRFKEDKNFNPIFIKISSSIAWFVEDVNLFDNNLPFDLYIIKMKYNENGKLIYFENNKGYWKKITYFETGEKSYVEDSNGSFTKFNEKGYTIESNSRFAIN